MGQLPKHKIEQLKKEKREAKAAKKRKVATRDKIVRFLIVCEGEKTEPNYFKALVKDKYSEIRAEEIVGEGKSTCSLVNKTSEIKKRLEYRRQLPFDRIWVVFDKDDFNDFNEAIELAYNYGFNSAWSNEAFELWYLLHFVYLDAAVSREDYISKLETEVKKTERHSDFKYSKNNPDIYRILQEAGNEEQAKKNAIRLRHFFEGSSDYKNHKPCTTVDLLVEELEHPETIKLK